MVRFARHHLAFRICAWHFAALTLGGLSLAGAPFESRLDNAFLVDDFAPQSGAAVSRSLDYADKQAGDFSLRFEFASDGDHVVELRPGSGARLWSMDAGDSLRFWARTSVGQGGAARIGVEDASGRGATAGIKLSDAWADHTISFESLEREEGFATASLARVTIHVSLPAGARLWLDDARWERAGGAVVGITDRTITQQMAEARESRSIRVAEAMKHPVTEGLREGLNRFVAELETARDLRRTNDELLDVLTTTDLSVRDEYRLSDLWCLVTNQTLYRIYYSYGSKGRVRAGSLREDAERALLAELWDRTHLKNDIAIARQSTWWLEVSENHDVIAKVSNLLASQIFAGDSEYANRALPNTGHGGGYGFWYSFLYSDGKDPGPPGRAKDADGRDHTAADHVAAWTAFWKEYLVERAKRGFFVEVSSPNYMEVTLTHLYDLAELAEDAGLRELATRFIDLFWLEWAQDQIGGVRGGAKTRSSGALVAQDALFPIMRFEMGGAALAKSHHFSVHHHPYRLPRIVWELALDREGLGEFAYVSRKPGESNAEHPRPRGTERSILVDTPSRYRRESWVTPDYVLGTQMDHPDARHSHLSTHARWHGMIFAGDRGARVFPAGLEPPPNGKGAWRVGRGVFRSAQRGRVMITQEARNISRETPDWLGTYAVRAAEVGVFFTPGYDRLVEREGWIFIEEGNAYLAVKPIISEYPNDSFRLTRDYTGDGPPPILDGAYQWTPDGRAIRFIDRHSPVIFEASRREHHPTLDAFIADVLDNPLHLERTVYPGFNIVRYRGCGDDAHDFVFNAASMEIPMIDGRYIDYEVPAFDSPWLFGAYGSGVITARKGDLELTLDFPGMVAP